MKFTDKYIFKKFNMLRHQINENQNYFETSSYPFKMGRRLFLKLEYTVMTMEKRKHLSTAYKSENWNS